MTHTVKFIDVGRNKENWRKDYSAAPTAERLESEVRKSGALMSGGIDVDIDGKTGSIWVGGFRKVGSIEIQEFQAVTA